MLRTTKTRDITHAYWKNTFSKKQIHKIPKREQTANQTMQAQNSTLLRFRVSLEWVSLGNHLILEKKKNSTWANTNTHANSNIITEKIAAPKSSSPKVLPNVQNHLYVAIRVRMGSTIKLNSQNLFLVCIVIFFGV